MGQEARERGRGRGEARGAQGGQGSPGVPEALDRQLRDQGIFEPVDGYEQVRAG